MSERLEAAKQQAESVAKAFAGKDPDAAYVMLEDWVYEVGPTRLQGEFIEEELNAIYEAGASVLDKTIDPVQA